MTSSGRISLIINEDKEYMHTVKTDETVNITPSFFNPYKNKGIFINRRKTERLTGVISPKSIDVPENPLSNNETGDRNILTPMAFTIPAISRKTKL